MVSKVQKESITEAENNNERTSVSAVETTDPVIALAIPIPSAPPLEDSVMNVVAVSISDDEANAAVEAARADGISTIRNHCIQHLSNNPNSTYVTWISTLHPENAHVVIDPRLLTQDNNPWLAVFEETKNDLQRGRLGDDRNAPSYSTSNIASGKDTDKNESMGKKFGCLDFTIGSALVLQSVIATIAIEVVAVYCYLSYYACHQIMIKCGPPSLFTFLPFFTTLLLGNIFNLLDVFLLLTSIVIVECTACVSYIVCTLLACDHDQGRLMHQMTRKLPHLIRWASRKKFEEWNNPPRATFSYGCFLGS
jgi:hypothetical protein